MPTEFVFELWAKKSFLLPKFTGYVARAIFLHMVKQVNPKASAELHEPNLMKPYSTMPLFFKSREKTVRGYFLDPNYPCILKIRLLNDEYAQYVMRYLWKRSSVMIGSNELQILSVGVKGETYEELEGSFKPVRAFRVYFKTPTYLATMSSGYYWLFPEPLKIFPNLMRLWNLYSTAKKYSKEEFKEYKKWLTGNLGVTQHKLETKMAEMGRKKAVGFVGWAAYETRDLESPYYRTTQTLAKFAEYSNIGGNRTGGFGVVKIKPKPNEESSQSSQAETSKEF
jgi:CRISPR-associated endoribonuclease Cas6